MNNTVPIQWVQVIPIDADLEESIAPIQWVKAIPLKTVGDYEDADGADGVNALSFDRASLTSTADIAVTEANLGHVSVFRAEETEREMVQLEIGNVGLVLHPADDEWFNERQPDAPNACFEYDDQEQTTPNIFSSDECCDAEDRNNILYIEVDSQISPADIPAVYDQPEYECDEEYSDACEPVERNNVPFEISESRDSRVGEMVGSGIKKAFQWVITFWNLVRNRRSKGWFQGNGETLPHKFIQVIPNDNSLEPEFNRPNHENSFKELEGASPLIDIALERSLDDPENIDSHRQSDTFVANIAVMELGLPESSSTAIAERGLIAVENGCNDELLDADTPVEPIGIAAECDPENTNWDEGFSNWDITEIDPILSLVFPSNVPVDEVINFLDETVLDELIRGCHEYLSQRNLHM